MGKIIMGLNDTVYMDRHVECLKVMEKYDLYLLLWTGTQVCISYHV